MHWAVVLLMMTGIPTIVLIVDFIIVVVVVVALIGAVNCDGGNWLLKRLSGEPDRANYPG